MARRLTGAAALNWTLHWVDEVRDQRKELPSGRAGKAQRLLARVISTYPAGMRDDDASALTDDERSLIRALRPAMAALMRDFDDDLQRFQRMSHAEYIALMFLSEAPEYTMRLSDLAELCQQSASAVGRTVKRLEAEGLVRRQQSVHDARSFNATLTEAGVARLEEAVPVHVASVRRHFFDQLEGVDLGKLALAFQRIAQKG